MMKAGRTTGLILAAAVVWLAPAVAARADGPATQPGGDLESMPVNGSQEAGGGSGWGGWAQMLGAMAVVVGMVFALRWGLRRCGAGVRNQAGQAPSLEVLGGRALSSRHHVYLVRMGGRVVMIGASPGSLSTLAETDAARFDGQEETRKPPGGEA